MVVPEDSKDTAVGKWFTQSLAYNAEWAALEEKAWETPMYDLKRDSIGMINSIRRLADGSNVPLDATNPEYQAFLEWNSQQDSPFDTNQYVFPRDHLCFVRLDELVEYCKESGMTLYVDMRSRGTPHFPRATTVTYPDKGQVGMLYKAVAARGDLDDLGEAGGLVRWPSKLWVPFELVKEMDNELQNDDGPVRRLSSWPIDRCFVYIDVSDFSQHPAGQQSLIIKALAAIIDEPTYWQTWFASESRRDLEARLCIGDGYIFVLRNALQATCFAAYLACLIELLVARRKVPVEFHFRMGVHAGPVYCFWDAGRGSWNYIGDGINGGQRVLAAVGKDTDDALFISGQVRQALTAQSDGSSPYPQVMACLANRGRQTDKHGRYWRVYEVNHTELCEKTIRGLYIE